MVNVNSKIRFVVKEINAKNGKTYYAFGVIFNDDDNFYLLKFLPEGQYKKLVD